MATMTIRIDNDTLFKNVKNILRRINGVTIVREPAKNGVEAKSAKMSKDISGIGGAWASEDFPTAEEIHAMRKTYHSVAEL